MAVQQTIPSLVPQLIWDMHSKFTATCATTLIGLAEAGFYSNIKGCTPSKIKLFNWIHETSISRIHEIQMIFSILNAGSILFHTAKLVEVIPSNYFSRILKNDPSWFVKPVLTLSSLTAMVTLGIYVVNRCISFNPPKTYQPTRDAIFSISKETANQLCGAGYRIQQQSVGDRDLSTLEERTILIVTNGGEIIECFVKGVENYPEVTVSSNQTTVQKYHRTIQKTKLVLNIAFAYFTKNDLMSVFSLLPNTYSILKNMQLKWLVFSQRCKNQSNQQLDMIYQFLAFPGISDDTCAVCQESEGAKIAFCVNHLFHEKCLAELIANKTFHITSHSSNFIKQPIRYYRDGVYSHTSYRYSITVERTDFPTCPSCRKHSSQDKWEMRLVERGDVKVYQVIVNVNKSSENRQYLFENVYAIYNVAQASLAALQTYPELSVAIYNIQKMMIISDLVAYGTSVYYLYDNLCKKWKQQDSKTLRAIAAATCTAAVASSYLIFFKLQVYLKSTTVLKEMLSTLPISPEILKDITVNWNGPVSHKIIQCLFFNRIIAMFALSFFSEKRRQNLLGLTAQILSLLGITKLNWIEFTQNRVPQNPFITSLLLNVSTYSLVDRNVDLKTALQSICNYTTSFFAKSYCEKIVINGYLWGMKVNTIHHYKIYIQNRILELNPGSFYPQLVSYTAKIIEPVGKSFFGEKIICTIQPVVPTPM